MTNDSFILRVTREGDALRLRIDLDSALTGELGEMPVREIVYHGVRNLDAVMQMIGDKEGSQIDVEEQETGVRLWIDYAIDYEEIECAGAEEKRCSYTREDLVAKSKSAVASLDRYATLYHEEQKKHRRLPSELEQMAKAELDRATRRREFFERQAASQALREDGTIKAYTRILKLLDSD